MKKAIVFFLCLALMPGLCLPALGQAASVHLTSSAQTMYVNKTLQLHAAVAPQGLPLVYASSKESVATVDESGLITAHGRGAAVITVASAKDSSIKDTVKITVRTAPSRITLKAEKLVLALGQSENLRAKIEPGNADNKRLRWSSSDPSVATVDKNGRVTLHAPGPVLIVASSQADPTVFATLEIREEQLAQKLAFQEEQISLPVGGQAHLVNPRAQSLPIAEDAFSSAYTLEPADITDASVSFKSSHPQIAAVDANGQVTGLAPGKAIITATSQDGSQKQDSLVVEVTQPVTGVTLSADALRIGVGRSDYLYALLTPKDATCTEVTWTSSNPAIATVSGSGPQAKITVHAWGECALTGVTQDGGHTASAVIHGGSYDRAVSCSALELTDGRPSIVLTNASNETVAQVRFRLRAFDSANEGIPVSANARHPLEMEGLYEPDLAPGEQTLSDRFYFEKPSGVLDTLARLEISRIEMAITGLTLASGLSFDFPENQWQWIASR